MVDGNLVNEKDWFFIFRLAKLGLFQGISLTTQEIADKIDSAQQTVSRRLKKLLKVEILERKSLGKNNTLKITSKGVALLKLVYFDLENIFDKKKSKHKQAFYGNIQTGMGEGKYYVSIPKYFEKFSEFLGNPPFPGTLNLELADECIENYYINIVNQNTRIIPKFETEHRTFGSVQCYDIWLYPTEKKEEKIKCVILDIRRTSHKKGTVEIVSNYNLRNKFNLVDNSKIQFNFIC
ncbi:MAG: DUF120 domain-containing protein [Promethearchaeota archaeon]